MIQEIRQEIESAVEELVNKAWETNTLSFLLLIARADMVKGLKGLVGTVCVTDFMGDLYKGETSERFYIRYMNKYYHEEGFYIREKTDWMLYQLK